MILKLEVLMDFVEKFIAVHHIMTGIHNSGYKMIKNGDHGMAFSSPFVLEHSP